LFALLSVSIVFPAIALGLTYALSSGDYRSLLSHQALTPFVTIAFAALGGLVASRRPRNPIGWIFLAVAVFYALSALAAVVTVYTASLPPHAALPWHDVAAWANLWIWIPGVFLPTVFVLLYFPDGQLPSPRWRPLAWAGALGLVAAILGLALHPGPVASWGTGLNPYGVRALAPLLDVLANGGTLLLLVGLLGSLVAFVSRFRHSRGVERQQMKWLLYAAALMVLGFVLSGLAWFLWPDNALVAEVSIALTSLTILGIALAAAMAILRYRLYDIDLIINRTLVYGGLSMVIAVLYVFSVGATGLALQQGSRWAGLLLTVALATLFFIPLRRRVQHGVDRLILPAGPASSSASRPAASEARSGVSDEARALAGNTQWIVLLPAGLLILLALSFLWLRLTTPFDGARLQPGQEAVTSHGLIVTPVEDRPAALQAGDVVVAVAGRSMVSWAEALFSGEVAGPRWQLGHTVPYTVLRDGQRVDVDVGLRSYPLLTVARQNWGTILFALVTLFVAAFVFARRPRVRAAGLLFLSAAALFGATTWSLGAQVGDFVDGIGFWLFQLTTFGAYTLYWTVSFHFALVFPRPLISSARRKWLTPLFYGVPYLLSAAYLLWLRRGAANALDWIGDWGAAADLHAAVFLSLSLVAAVQQYRLNRTGVRRQQVRWVMLAALVAGGAGLFLYILPPLLGREAIPPNYIGLIVLVFPLAIAIAILRHNLFDIDALLNRALVYGALSAIIIALYVLVVGMLGTVFQTRGDLFVALVATGLAAVLFQPLRDRLQRGANRLIYGQRDEPFEVVARLGRRLEATVSPDATLSAVVTTVAEALKLPYVAIALPGQADELETVVSYGKPVTDPAAFPLQYQGQIVGRLLAAPRAADESFAAAEERILRSVAHQAGAAVRAARLTADLQRSRRQLVTAREEERRRLRRDLHDGLGPALAALHLQAGMARRLLGHDPEEAADLISDLQDEIREAIEDVRRLVYALRPPVLDQLGLVAALRAQAAEHGRVGDLGHGPGQGRLQIQIEAPETLPPLPAAVEVAAYRIVREALTNVVRHAQAKNCRVSLRLHEGLTVEVTDDGRGLPRERRAGVGLLSMRERAEELGGVCTIDTMPGGGTRVLARLPLPEQEGDVEV
jgi:signal transduction histidine kinase